MFSGAGAFQVQLAKGVVSGTTDASGNTVVNHNSSAVPNGAVTVFMSDSASVDARPTEAFTSTQMTVNFRTSTSGAVLANGAYTLAYDCFFVQ